VKGAGSLAAKLALGLASVLATLIFLELVLSALFEPVLRVWQVQELFQLDDELIYSLRPNRERVAVKEEFTERASTNSVGLRDDPIRARAEFDERIVVLGDSMIFGHGVDDTETFPNQLEAVLRESHRNVDVINAGIKGYGTDGAYKLWTSRLAPLGLEPDLVIFAIYHNDLHDNIGQPLYSIENGALTPLDPTKNWIYLLGNIDRHTPEFFRNRILYGLVLSRFVGHDVYNVLPELNEAELVDWAARKALLQITHLAAVGKHEGFGVMVLGVPYRDGAPHFYDWLAPVAKRGVQFFDPSLDPSWSKEKERLFFEKDYHLSPAGNRLLAEKVAEALAPTRGEASVAQ
jgi:lysophospholipase L1-like esterase